MRNFLRTLLVEPGWELQTTDDLRWGGLVVWLRHPDGREHRLPLSNAEVVNDPAGCRQRILNWAATVGQSAKTRQIEVE